MKKLILGGSLSVLALLLIALGVGWSGAVSFAADEPHSEVVTKLIGWARERAIVRASSEISPPHDLANQERIRHGAGNYEAMCVECHLAPGTEDTEIRKGLYPVPPNLSREPASADPEHADSRRFWIIKHGIKGSAMAGWSKGGMDDDAIWNLVAFLRQLPRLSGEDYAQLLAHSGGHSHAGLEGDAQGPARPLPVSATPGSSAGHDAHTHPHGHAPH